MCVLLTVFWVLRNKAEVYLWAASIHKLLHFLLGENTTLESLSEHISHEELTDNVRTLKNNKSCGPDRINLSICISKVFNLIIDTEQPLTNGLPALLSKLIKVSLHHIPLITEGYLSLAALENCSM